MCDLKKEKLLFKLFAINIKLLRAIILKIYSNDLLLFINKCINKKISHMNFDVAWACAEGQPVDWIKDSNIKKKFVWLHNDYNWECARGVNSAYDFENISNIVSVSQYTADAFIKNFSNLQSKIIVLYNLINSKDILNSRKIEIGKFPQNTFNIVSIGRFAYQKQFEIIPQITRELLNLGHEIKWYIIGNGGVAETKIINDKIKEYDVSENVILLGEQSNPYPFLKQGSLFALTSRYESYPTVINEAKILQIPIISTCFSGVEEILNEKHGIICPIENFTENIANLIDNSDFLANIKNNKYNFEQHNQTQLQKFYEIIES